MTSAHDAAVNKIIGLIQSELYDKTQVITMSTLIEDVKFDSTDMLHVIFRVEEEYGMDIDLVPDLTLRTVGDFVNALVAKVETAKPAQ